MKKIRFYNADGKELDIRDEDIGLGIDLVKNAQNEAMREGEKEELASLFRLWHFLISIRAGLTQRQMPGDN